MEMEHPKSGLTIMEFNLGFDKLLNENGHKRTFMNSGLTTIEFNKIFDNLLYDNRWNGILQALPDVAF